MGPEKVLGQGAGFLVTLKVQIGGCKFKGNETPFRVFIQGLEQLFCGEFKVPLIQGQIALPESRAILLVFPPNRFGEAAAQGCKIFIPLPGEGIPFPCFFILDCWLGIIL